MYCDRRDTATVSPSPVKFQADPELTEIIPKRTWDACAGLPECEVPLAQLDSAIQFGDEFPEPIRYDAAHGVLRYRGTMSHASFMRLQSLTRDRHYQRALEKLFVASAMPVEAPRVWPRRAMWVGLPTAAVVMLAGGWFVMSGRVPDKAPGAEKVVLTADGGMTKGTPMPGVNSSQQGDRVAQPAAQPAK